MMFDIQARRQPDVFPVVNTPKVENQHTDVQHGTPQTSPCLHFFGVHTSLSCDLFTVRYSCNPCTLQGLLHSRLQTPIGKTEVIKNNVARALFWYTAFLVPSARGDNGVFHLFQPARVMAAASAPFLAASWRVRAAANG